MSSECKLQNKIESLKVESDKKIESCCYYIVSITISNIFLKDLKIIAKEFCEGILPFNSPAFHNSEWAPPILAYISNDNIQFLFSTTDETHNLGGSQQKICSLFTSIFTLRFSKYCETTVIELQERYLILCYFQCKIYNYSIKRMGDFLRKRKPKKNVNFKTLTNRECLQILKENGIDWKSIRNYLKYGIFMKITGKENDNYKYKLLSESMDIFTRLDYYQSYFFN